AKAPALKEADVNGVAPDGGKDLAFRRRAAGGEAARFQHGNEMRKQLEQRLKLGQGVSPAATASQLGDYFQYVLDRPVTLPRQKSALLPILNKEVEGTRVSIYNEQVQAQFPLHGLKFKNTSGAHLMQGPLTVFEGS